MRILHVTPAFFPATYWGGPMYSLHGLCNALAQLPGVELRVLTTDTAGPGLHQRLNFTYPARYPAGYNVWFTRRRLGASFAPQMYAALPSFVRWADVVHLTAVYSSPTLPTLALCRAMSKPLVWSPRGSLQRWSGSRNRLPKRVLEIVARRLVDPARASLHCTSIEEADASRSRMNLKAFVVPNGIEMVASRPRPPRVRAEPLRVLYVGRIHPIKGLDHLIQAVALAPQGVMELTIAGGGDPKLLSRLRNIGQNVGLSDRIRFPGHVEGEAKEKLFDSHDVLVLPSHRENFGMVIVEALSRGMPVVASHGTPWQAAEQHGCGLWVANDPESLHTALTRLMSADLEAMGIAGMDWMASEFSWNAIANRMFDIYETLVAPS
jgi:glycosyltransferase involved in cell wall biosynthesis